MELYNADGEVVRANFSSDISEAFGYTIAEAGTYYIKIYTAQFVDNAPDGTLLSYQLEIDLPEEIPSDGNDSRANATRFDDRNRIVTSGTGVDWYQFETGPGIMDFTLGHTGAVGPDGQVMDLNLELYNYEGQVVGSAFKENTDESFSYLSRSTGTYYLKVYWAAFPNGAPNGYALNYTLNLDLPVNTWSVPLEFGPIRDASVALYDIDNDGRDEVFVGTSKSLDADGNEVRPAGLIVLEDDGQIKWSHTFAAFPGLDPRTGLEYETTSVSTQPIFSDVNGDGTIDIVVGVGGDNRAEFQVPGQPGDLGGVYALDANGKELWFHQTRDSFGASDGGPDGRPDGVYGSPRVFDIDADGVREVIFTSWDHYLYVLDGRDGSVEKSFNLHDTAGATPAIADLNNDGLYELVVPADITNNETVGLPDQGGILHVLSNYGQPNIEGWDQQVANTSLAYFRGKFEEQSLWSSPRIFDLDRDGTVEIIQGTGDFFKDGRGEYFKIWNADGTLRQTITTAGRVLAAPIVADLNGDGSMEIITATTAGHVQAWRADGSELFDVRPRPFNNNLDAEATLPIVRQPVAVDLNDDGNLELLVTIASQVIVLDASGNQISNTAYPEREFSTYAGSPAVADVDRDGLIDIFTGGTSESHDQAIVYRWENITDTPSSAPRVSSYQENQSLHEIRSFVDRFYSTILNRNADAAGRNDWTDELYSGVLSGAQVAQGFINSREFQNRETSDAHYVNILYAAFFDRNADSGGYNTWMNLLSSGGTREEVLEGFIGSREFANLANSYGIRAKNEFGTYSDAPEITGRANDTDVLRGGSGNNILYDENDSVFEPDVDEKEISGQVFRLYRATLDRSPNAAGFQNWFNGLSAETGISLEEAAGGFVGSREFDNTYGKLTDGEFVELLYQNVLNRGADAGGLAHWQGMLDGGASRADVVLGFSESREFKNATYAALDNFMRSYAPAWIDVLEGGAGDDLMNGGTGSDVFVFRRGQGGNDTIHGFEPWDELQLSGFGFNSGADARARMSQSGANVVFSHHGQTITFLDTTMAEMTRVRYNVS